MAFLALNLWIGALVIGGLLLASVSIKNVWCRYLCPYGALLGLVSLVGPALIPDAGALTHP